MISRLNFLFLCTVVFAANSVEAKAKTGETVDSCAGIFLPITAGYGADSIRAIRVEYHKPAAFRHGAIYLYRPETVSVRHRSHSGAAIKATAHTCLQISCIGKG